MVLATSSAQTGRAALAGVEVQQHDDGLAGWSLGFVDEVACDWEDGGLLSAGSVLSGLSSFFCSI